MREHRDKWLVFDVETTGLSPAKDEILSLAIMDADGNVLFDSLIKPTKHKSWPKAQEVNGISPDDVASCPTISERLDEINAIFSKAEALIGYNVEFDIKFLRSAGVMVPEVEVFDVMKEYAAVYGERCEWKDGENKWVKLSECAEHYGYQFNAHDSLEDVKATLWCFDRLREDPAHVTAVKKLRRDTILGYLRGVVRRHPKLTAFVVFFIIAEVVWMFKGCT